MQHNFTNFATNAEASVYPSKATALTLYFLYKVSFIQHLLRLCVLLLFFFSGIVMFVSIRLKAYECQLAIVTFLCSREMLCAHAMTPGQVILTKLTTLHQFWHVTNNSTGVTSVLRLACSSELSDSTSGFGCLLIFSFLSSWRLFT